ncbi:hypothetical protein [Stenotrophomonas sp. SrG]|uniref:hypothetical protein n=1 Tax=Stenotrophomonas sp. SrG TaxID=3414430 RepID=UPI003CF69C29
MSRPVAPILAPLAMWALFCGFAAAGCVLAVMHDSLFALLVMRGVLAASVYQTVLEWQRAEKALASRRIAAAETIPAVPQDLQ